MKKITFFTALTVIAMFFTACKEHQTVQTDQTKLYPAMDVSGENWGYIDAKGNFAIPSIYDNVSGFSCGYARVELANEIKFIDKSGKLQNTLSFDYAGDFYYGYSTIVLDGKFGLMNKKFEMTIQPYFFYLGTMGDNGLIQAMLSDDSKYEYVNSKGETKISAMYDKCTDFKDGVAIVTLNKKFGAINKSGNFTVQPTYEYGLWNIGNGLVGFTNKDDEKGILDKNGNIIKAAIYDDIDIVSDGMIQYKKGDKYGYLNDKGEDVLSPIYAHANPFYEGQAWVKQSKDSKWMSIDKNAQIQFYLLDEESPVSGFHNGLALVRTNDGDYKYVNKQGALIYSWSNVNKSLYVPLKIKEKQGRSLVEINKEFSNMTLNFDSRKL